MKILKSLKKEKNIEDIDLVKEILDMGLLKDRKEVKDRLEELDIQHNSLRENIDEQIVYIEEKISSISNDLNFYRNGLDNINDKFPNIDIYYQELTAKYDDLKKNITKYSEYIGQIVETLGQFGSNSNDKIKDLDLSLRKNISLIDEKYISLLKDLESVKDDNNKSFDKFSNLDIKFVDFEKQLSKLNKNLYEFGSQLQVLKNGILVGSTGIINFRNGQNTTVRAVGNGQGVDVFVDAQGGTSESLWQQTLEKLTPQDSNADVYVKDISATIDGVVDSYSAITSDALTLNFNDFFLSPEGLVVWGDIATDYLLFYYPPINSWFLTNDPNADLDKGNYYSATLITDTFIGVGAFAGKTATVTVNYAPNWAIDENGKADLQSFKIGDKVGSKTSALGNLKFNISGIIVYFKGIFSTIKSSFLSFEFYDGVHMSMDNNPFVNNDPYSGASYPRDFGFIGLETVNGYQFSVTSGSLIGTQLDFLPVATYNGQPLYYNQSNNSFLFWDTVTSRWYASSLGDTTNAFQGPVSGDIAGHYIGIGTNVGNEGDVTLEAIKNVTFISSIQQMSDYAGGGISNSLLNNPGSGYQEGDEVSVDSGGTNPSIIQINSVDGGGGVTGYSVITAGIGYSLGTNISTTNSNGGSGTGFTIDILSLTTPIPQYLGTNNNWCPLNDNSYDLGFLTNRWKNVNAVNFIGSGQQLTDVVHAPQTPPEGVDASRTVFTVSARPSYVVADGVTYFEGFGYSYATGQITLDVAPSQFIRYFI